MTIEPHAITARLCRLLSAAGAVVAIATLLGFLGSFSWFFDLFSHFRVQYMFGLLVIGILLWLAKNRKMAGIFLWLAFVNMAVVFPFYFGKQSIDPKLYPLRAMLLNVNTSLGDAARVRTVIESEAPDFLVLEEINARWLTDLAWLTNAYPYRVIQPREDNFGIALYSKFPLQESRIFTTGDAEVPSIIATAQTEEKKLCIVATHPLPPFGENYSRMRNEHLENLPVFLTSPHPLLLLGDLNVTPWNTHFRKLLKTTGLRDSTKGFGYQPSWPSHAPLFLIPLDHCLHSEKIGILDRRIGNNVSSDHYPLIVGFVILK